MLNLKDISGSIKPMRGFAVVIISLCPWLVSAESASTSVITLSPVYFLKLGLALVLVLSMFFILAYIVKRFNGLSPSANTGLKIVAALALGSREKLVVVEAGNCQIILGITPGNICKVHVLEDHINPQALSVRDSFKEKLGLITDVKNRPVKDV